MKRFVSIDSRRRPRPLRCCAACKTIGGFPCGNPSCGCHIGITLDCRDGLHQACKTCGCRCHKEAA